MFFFANSKSELRESEIKLDFVWILRVSFGAFETFRSPCGLHLNSDRPFLTLLTTQTRSEIMSQAIQKLSNVAKCSLVAAKPKLRVFLHYAKTELTPPTPGELPQAIAGVGRLVKSAKWSRVKNLTVREAWLNTLIGVEVVCWFFVGEVIGRGRCLGLQIDL